MFSKPNRNRKNVDGDFYVEDGCCTGCLVWEFHAPNLLAFDKTEKHCFVAKQPTDESEVYQAIKATWAAELECIRYCGQDPQILRRLVEAGLANSCDQKHLIEGITPLLRNHVTFEFPQIKSELEIAGQFREYILGQSNEYLDYHATNVTSDEWGFTFAFTWFEDEFYSVWLNRLEATGNWHIFHSPDIEKIGSRGVSVMIDEWLRSNQLANIKWYTNATWKKDSGWLETPL